MSNMGSYSGYYFYVQMLETLYQTVADSERFVGILLVMENGEVLE